MATLKIQELREDERPREKLAAKGPAALSESELIAILLRVGTQGANAIDVAKYDIPGTDTGALDVDLYAKVDNFAALCLVLRVGPPGKCRELAGEDATRIA